MALDVYSETFWFELREKTAVHSGDGKGVCRLWRMQALQLLLDYVSATRFEKVTLRGKAIKRLGLNYHCFLVDKGREFVADGTAGQMDPRFPKGYYGLLKDAPQPLNKVYQLAFK